MDSSNILISFIIPAYNAEQTIVRAINSIYCSKENLIEVIVVENGSTDKTIQIVLELKNRYKSLKLLHSEKGVSKARNAALKIAKGDWIVFVDADDYLEPNAVEILLHDAVESSTDFYLYGHKAGSLIKRITSNLHTEIYCSDSIEECRIKMIENPTRYMQVWAKLYKKSIVEENGIMFAENMHFSEDSDFTLKYSKYCNSICFSNEVIYVYSIDNQSVMRTYDGKKMVSYVYAMEKTSEFIEDESSDIKIAFQKYILMHMNIVMVREIFSKNNPHSLLTKYRQMKEVSKIQVFDEAITMVKLDALRNARMLPILFIKLKIDIFAGVIYWLRAIQNARRERKRVCTES